MRQGQYLRSDGAHHLLPGQSYESAALQLVHNPCWAMELLDPVMDPTHGLALYFGTCPVLSWWTFLASTRRDPDPIPAGPGMCLITMILPSRTSRLDHRWVSFAWVLWIGNGQWYFCPANPGIPLAPCPLGNSNPGVALHSQACFASDGCAEGFGYVMES